MNKSATLNRTFEQSDFDDFAQLSGDQNPIHISAEFSANSRFGRPVAHGLLLLSVVRELADRVAPGYRMVEQDALFPAPTYAGDEMQFHCECPEAGDTKARRIQFNVTRAGDGVLTCRGSARLVAP